jgi:purine-nucleoside/S-methyl-5'-thioadenosine phosphorylase / adenosine deaminase
MTKQNNKIWLDADWPVPKHIRAGTSIRSGGKSATPFNELNLAQHVGDNFEKVKQNRKILSEHLQLQSTPVWLNQTHSSKIICIDRPSENQNADASYTSKIHKVCVVMTADCVPILLCNKDGSKIAAVHAGWRGICDGIIENSLKVFSNPETVTAWIGPCISQPYYEVGEEVYEGCLKHSDFLISAFEQSDTHHWHADLPKISKILLKNAGVGSIHECGLCTYKMDEMFYSYRRDGDTGRTASMIWME